jgi:hypothetical protein
MYILQERPFSVNKIFMISWCYWRKEGKRASYLSYDAFRFSSRVRRWVAAGSSRRGFLGGDVFGDEFREMADFLGKEDAAGVGIDFATRWVKGLSGSAKTGLGGSAPFFKNWMAGKRCC